MPIMFDNTKRLLKKQPIAFILPGDINQLPTNKIQWPETKNTPLAGKQTPTNHKTLLHSTLNALNVVHRIKITNIVN